ncbi:MAG: hypothetical protein JOY92_15255 [Verrucomicrobia bacterium]|nr:hypothetical protein [Verrucomicrobiota bacterium]
MRLIGAITHQIVPTGFPFSDDALKAIEQNKPRIFREDWKQVISIPALKESVRDICMP